MKMDATFPADHPETCLCSECVAAMHQRDRTQQVIWLDGADPYELDLGETKKAPDAIREGA